MSEQAPILRDIVLLDKKRKLLRPERIAVGAESLGPPSITPSESASRQANIPARSPARLAASDRAQKAQVTAIYDQGGSELGDTNAQQQAHKSGYEIGHQEGYQRAQREALQHVEQMAKELAATQVREALAQAEQQAHQHMQRLNAGLLQQHQLLEGFLQKLPGELERCLDAAEDDMLCLVYETVCRILGEEAVSMDGLRAQLHVSLKVWHGRAPISIHVHPDDMALLESDPASVEMLLASGFSAERSTLRWVADAKVALGGCMLRSAEGALDARLEVQLQALKTSVLQTRVSRKNLASMVEKNLLP